ncbi:serine/threonine-protein kinase ucn [Phtheirospermum japonicum]|uniref:non-specific serine/threonine protein kinase n=1 Tax=Phtheirospermum japonicum TaxID=374723 RepID=A0A830B630_9LAMI|nr:serine/threonine-protein kinase ucn [Phtheirospermum japonicum]
MGTVFLVHDKSHDDQPFALKVFEKSSDHHQADRRARHEIALLRRLSASPHPFLPHLIASSENTDFVCWAIPFCPGGDLNVLRQRQCDGVFSPAVIRFYLAEIISAVEHLHDQGIVYRDLKPEIFSFNSRVTLTLTDFDLSRGPGPQKITRLQFGPSFRSGRRKTGDAQKPHALHHSQKRQKRFEQQLRFEEG